MASLSYLKHVRGGPALTGDRNLMKRVVRLTFAALAPLGLLTAGAAAANPNSGTGTAVLNSYSTAHTGYSHVAKSTNKLAQGTWYVATVSGTISYYERQWYTKHDLPEWWNVECGKPDSYPMFGPSKGGRWPVGQDAEFVFARPWVKWRCQNEPFPQVWVNFQANAGSGWSHPQILGAIPTMPTRNHTYKYVLQGMNQEAKFRLVDGDTTDNYGDLHISLRPATTADCSNYSSFGFASETACQSALGSAS